MEIGAPIKRHTVVPLKAPVKAPEPSSKPLPKRPLSKRSLPIKEPARQD